MKRGDLVIYISPINGMTDNVPGVVMEMHEPWALVLWTDLACAHLVPLEWLSVIAEAGGVPSGSR